MKHVFETASIAHLLLLLCLFEQVSFAESYRLYGSGGLLALKSEELAALQGAYFLDKAFDIEAQKSELITQMATRICLARGYGGGADKASLFENDIDGKPKLLVREIIE